ASSKIYSSAAFGILIILVVFIPVLQLEGVEGKMFKPMALTLMFALGGAMILSLTYIPAAASVFLKKKHTEKKTHGERIMEKIRSAYAGRLRILLNHRKIAVGIALILMAASIWRISSMGSVFIPELEEGDLAMQMAVEPGSNLEETIKTSTEVESILLDNFPEVTGVVSKIGTAEVPTDPMAIEDADIMILLKPKGEWETAETREEMVNEMKSALTPIPEASFEFTQPIQLRFNELLTGSKGDIAIKIFGEDHETLSDLGREAETLISEVSGAADVKVERTEGLQQYVIDMDREKMAWYGVSTETVNSAIETAYAGTKTGVVLDGERRFDLVVRLQSASRTNPDLTGIFVNQHNGSRIPLSEVAKIRATEGPSMISRENTRRRITVGVNVRNRSLSEVVADIQQTLDSSLQLPPGYFISYEGEFKNLEEARKRLAIAVPISIGIIILLLFMAYRKWRYVFLVCSSIPLAAIGGIWLLSFRDMPFSISAGIGFIALFGVAVLNGIVLISHINELRMEEELSLRDAVVKGASDRIRPVLLTAMVATFGFIPMALSTSAGAEVQKPLATVVIGGLITATLLTLFVLPMLYEWIETRVAKKGRKGLAALSILLLCAIPGTGQDTISWESFREKALAENAYYKIETGKVDMAKARKSDAWEIGKTEAFYGYGQINRADITDDFLWSFNQNLGSIPQHIYKAKLRRAEIARSEADLEIFKVNFETDLEIAYLNWVAANGKVKYLRGFAAKLDSLDNRVENQLDAGGIDLEERLLFKSEVLSARKDLLTAKSELVKSLQKLEELCLFALENTAPAEDASYVTGLETPENLSPELLTAPRKLQIESQKEELNALRAGFFPEISLGYQVGRVEGVRGADAFSIGMALPIWYAPDKSRLKTAAINLHIEEAALRSESFYFESALKNATKEYLMRQEAFNRDGDGYKTGAETLEEKALTRYEQGETTVNKLIISISAAKNLRISHIDLLRDYGAAKIELKRFSTR
ncbi:MAG: efflux RND transporter permease subunit, partial [Flavobacteriales bacterium]|nr:efflux RND transporter permease subunit [Flavobacteriales bacterium]